MPLLLVNGKYHGSVGGGTPTTVFGNGYKYQFEMVISKNFIRSDLIDFETLVVETNPILKTVSNGGGVMSNGFDIRFELGDGTFINHAILKYDGATGNLITIVKIPQVYMTQHTHFYMYVGKTVSITEENRTDALNNWYSLWYPPYTTDYTNNGYTLTALGTYSSIVTDWGQAISFNGASTGQMFCQNFSALNNKSQWAVVTQAKSLETSDSNSGLMTLSVGPTIKLSVRFLTTRPSNYAAMVTQIKTILGLAGINVIIVDEIDIVLSGYTSVAGGDVLATPSTQHTTLYEAVKNAADPNIMFLCFVQNATLADGVTALRGFGSTGIPCAVIANSATVYTPIHELLHCLGLVHVSDTDNIMYNNSASITNLPPNIDPSQIITVQNSPRIFYNFNPSLGDESQQFSLRFESDSMLDGNGGGLNIFTSVSSLSDGYYKTDSYSTQQNYSTNWGMYTISKTINEAPILSFNGDYTWQGNQSLTARTGSNTDWTGTLRLGVSLEDNPQGGFTGFIGITGWRKLPINSDHNWALYNSWNYPRAFYSISTARMITDTNRVPVIPPRIVFGVSGSWIGVNPLIGTSDPEGDTLFVTSTTNGQNGTVVRTGNILTYQPSSVSFAGYDYFDATISDGHGTTNTRISIIMSNQLYTVPIEAWDDEVTMVKGTNITLYPLSNDRSYSVTNILYIDTTDLIGIAAINPDGKSINFSADSAFIGTTSFKYTATDGITRSVGTFKITTTNNTPIATARGDSAYTYAGRSVNIPVLLNDSPVSGLTLTACTNGSRGSTSISGNNIQYTPSSSLFTGDDFCTYTIKDALDNTSTANIQIYVAPLPATEIEYPIPLRTFTISSTADFNTKYISALPGDHFVIADGAKINVNTLNKSGTTVNPIIIRANKNQGSSWASNLVISGNNVILWGLQFPNIKITCTGSNVKLRRVWISGYNTVNEFALLLSGYNWKLEYCMVHNIRAAAGIGVVDTATGGKMYRCLISNFNTIATSNHPPFSIGGGTSSHTNSVNCTLSYCLIKDNNQSNTENSALIFNIGNVNLYMSNIVSSKNITMSYGNNSTLRGVKIKTSGNISIRGKNHILNGVWIDDAAGFSVETGNWDSTQSGNPPANTASLIQQPNALNITLIGCKGNVNIGTGGLSVRAQNIKIEDHLSPVVINNTQGGSTEWTTGSASESIITPLEILEEDVGLYANI